MDKQVYDYETKEFVEQPEKVKKFLEQIRKICEEYQLSIWKQDGYNIEFIIEKLKEIPSEITRTSRNQFRTTKCFVIF